MDFRDVFTPNDQPTVTYIKRSSKKLEANLNDYLETRNIVVSISGASKSGKTVLLKSTLDEDSIIPLNGSAIKTVDDFWKGIFSWMGAPLSTEDSSSKSMEYFGEAEGGGEVGIPLVAKGKTGARAGIKKGTTSSSAAIVPVDPFQQTIKEIGKSDFVIFLDDFHYVPKETQIELAKIIKGLAENGVRICTASVPHRNEDVVRANPELRGRLAALDIPEWEPTELEQIARKGFDELNADLSNDIPKILANEAFGTPQLMQALCMNLCKVMGLRGKLSEHKRIQVEQSHIEEALKDTSDFASNSSLVQALHRGPKVHGTERKRFQFRDGSTGDVYRAILLALASDPPTRQFSYDEIINRVRAVCVGETPVGSSISGSLGNMCSLAQQNSPDAAIIEWDEDVLNIVDPYFAFYLRCSGKLEQLASEK